MNANELLELVKKTSLDLMNDGKGDGTIHECYEDAMILRRFAGLTASEVVAKVAQLDGVTKECFDEVLLASGEYHLDATGKVVPLPRV